jgi:hypothetical protein
MNKREVEYTKEEKQRYRERGTEDMKGNRARKRESVAERKPF